MNHNLFDVEDLQDMPKVREMTVGHATTTDVNEFCNRYHYTATDGNQTWRHALWYGPTVLGIVAYNLPTPDVCGSVFGPEHQEHVWHMGRLALAESAPRNSESRLIAGSLRLIEAEHPEVWGIITYAAVDAGHIGYVYQATNAIYTGTGGKTYFYIDQKGKRRGGHLHGHVGAERAADLGWVRHEGNIKHRYIYILGNRRQKRARQALLQYPVLPYPKAVAL